jgi:1,4-dihydroxy-2-naphthoate octaprenyltransferase
VGEVAIFFLFGPALVMGGYFIQTGIFPDLKSFLLSLPFGIFTTAILFANEVPDFYDDQKSGKNTWVSLIGPKNSFKFYYFLIFTGFFSILLNVVLSFLSPLALITFLFIIPAVKAAKIIKKFYENKTELMKSSKLTIVVQNLVGVCLVLIIFFL